nr:hypothetical protein [Tanacetum cinerariifolium]
MQTQTSNTLHNAIMEAGSKDRPPMLAPDNYVPWKSRIKRYIDTKPNHELIQYCLKNPPYKFTYIETYKTISQEIRDQLNAEAEAVQIILTGIDNDIYSTTKDLDAYDSDCDDLSLAKMILMANLLICDSDLLPEESQDAIIPDTSSSAPYDLLVLSLVEKMTDYVAHLDKEIKQIKWKLKGKNIIDNAASKPSATIAPGMFKLDIEPISHRLKNNRDAHKELLVYVSKTCPSLMKQCEKLVDVTPINKDKKVRVAEPVTSLSSIPM